MTDLRNMKVDELKDIARGYSIVGAWKMTKERLIETILSSAKLNGDEDKYFDSAVEAEEPATEIEEEPATEIEEITTYEVDNPDNDEVTAYEVDNDADEEEPKTIKKPSLKIKELTYDGRTQTIKEWAAELEMPWPTLYDRINRNGWTTEEALTIPLGGRRSK